jgi:GntR family transcriptional regulator / MocR family aminotransferase
MRTRPLATPLPSLTLDPAGPTPIYRQVYQGVRAAILAGRLAPGTALPST